MTAAPKQSATALMSAELIMSLIKQLFELVARHCVAATRESGGNTVTEEMATLARLVSRFALATPSAPALLFMPAASTKLNVW